MRRRVLDLLQNMISEKFRRIQVLKMTGEVPVKERAEIEHNFQNKEECSVLLLTVGVGGVGLNLTAASHVIHFDRCYNPAKEQQATDRAHRLGQRNAVCVHTLVTEGTFEERLDEIMKEKAELSSLTITSADDWIANYNDDQVRELFMLRSTADTRKGKAGRPSLTKQKTRQSSSQLSDIGQDSPAASSASTSASTPKPQVGKRKHSLIGEVNPVSTSSLSASSSSQDLGKRPRRQWSGLGGPQTASMEQRPATEGTQGEVECSVCMDGPASHLLLPCGHQCLCGDCVGLVSLCPICRASIQKRVNVRSGQS
jgi:hypothetical protein